MEFSFRFGSRLWFLVLRTFWPGLMSVLPKVGLNLRWKAMRCHLGVALRLDVSRILIIIMSFFILIIIMFLFISIIFMFLFILIALSVLAVLIWSIALIISWALIFNLTGSKVIAPILLHVADLILIKVYFSPELVRYLLQSLSLLNSISQVLVQSLYLCQMALILFTKLLLLQFDLRHLL